MPVVGVGTDVADVARFARLLEHGGQRFLERWFRPTEVEWLSTKKARARHTAALFAAKEAALKAVRVPDLGPVRWREIEITHGLHGGPGVVVHGSVRELADAAGVSDFHLALWHDDRVATATVVAVSEPARQLP